jgi:hypothetical protein
MTAAPTPPGEPTHRRAEAAHGAERNEFAYYTHQNLQDMVKLADQKAATIIGGGGIIVAVLGSNLIDRFKPTAPVLIVAGMVSLGLLVAAVLSAVLVLWPRLPTEKDVALVPGAPRLLWAKDIAAYHRNPTGYAKALLALAPPGALLDLAYENLKITWLLDRKWMWQKRAMHLLLVAFIAWFATIGLALKEGKHVEGNRGAPAAAQELRRDEGPRRQAAHEGDEPREPDADRVSERHRGSPLLGRGEPPAAPGRSRGGQGEAP